MNSPSLSLACSRQAKVVGSRIAFRNNNDVTTFSEFESFVSLVASFLAKQGALQGDRVALLAKDSIAAYALFFACVRIGAVFVPLNWRFSRNELGAILTDSGAKYLFVQDDFADKVDEHATILQRCRIENVQPHLLAEHCPAPNDGHSIVQQNETPVVQIYTSGTTGRPKGVVLANRTFFDLLSGMEAIGDPWMGLLPNDTLLLSLPIFHIGGLWWAVQGFLAGACGVQMESFVGWKAIELIERHRITKVAMVPAMIQFTLSEPSIETANLSSVTGFLYGGSPISQELLRRVRKYIPCDFFQIYGLTETGNMAVCLRPTDHSDERLWAAAGKPLPGVEVKIVPNQTSPVQNTSQLGPEALADLGKDIGESASVSGSKSRTALTPSVGEIWLKSPSVMLGYWNNEEATQEVLDQGWIRTGDAGYVDEKGYLFVCDRIKDMIIYAGENIFPSEIESVLREHDAIADAAVIGVPDPISGELAKAFLVLKPNSSKPKTKDLFGFLRNRIADFKIPKSFEIVDSLPRNPSGKILKHVLRKPYWENYSRKVN